MFCVVPLGIMFGITNSLAENMTAQYLLYFEKKKVCVCENT